MKCLGPILLALSALLAGCGTFDRPPAFELPVIDRPAAITVPVTFDAQPAVREVFVAAMIDEHGRLTDSFVLGSSDPALEPIALVTLPHTTFLPARTHGRVLAAHVAISFDFLDDAPLLGAMSVASLGLPRRGRAFTTDLRFCQADKLDRPPRLLHDVRPEPRTGSGAVKLQFFIDQDGRVRMPMIFSSDDPELSRAALEAVKGWRFTVPTRGGQPIIALVRQEFRFGGG